MLLVQNGMNGLHLASKEGHINVVLELLARAASVDSSTKVNCSKCNLLYAYAATRSRNSYQRLA